SPLEYSPRFIAVLVPFLVVTATLGLSALVRHRRVLVVSATAVGLVIMGGALLRRPADGTARVAAEDLNQVLKEGLPRHSSWIMLCDAPTVYAWIWNAQAVWTPVPEDVQKVRELLEDTGTLAIFTRAGGRGDGLASDTVDRYAEAGLIADRMEPPLVMHWPPPARYGPVAPEGSPP
ncbi:MAG TPA: hypothetical protein VFP10_15830, partial [Candidatus Eisenbacteria bacterium]|nr:hypothetical protein [Candidatus Eisenbacteria bacterium]